MLYVEALPVRDESQSEVRSRRGKPRWLNITESAIEIHP